MKKWLVLLAIIIGTTPTWGLTPARGFCEVGNTAAVTSGMSSTNRLQASYPRCRVTVYDHGTTNTAAIYSDASGTPLANPFTANTNGSWMWYAADGRYDTVLSGGDNGGFPTPFTVSDINLNAGGGGGDVTAVVGQAAYGSGSTSVQTRPTELAVDAFAGADAEEKTVACMSALPSTGGVCKYSAGNYSFPATVTVTKPNITFRCAGKGNLYAGNTGGTTLTFAAGVAGFVFDGALRANFEDCTLVGAATVAGSDDGIRITNTTLTASRISIKGFGGNGVTFDNLTNLSHFQDVESLLNKGDGWHWNAGCTDNNQQYFAQVSAFGNLGHGFDMECGVKNEFHTMLSDNNTGGDYLINSSFNTFYNIYAESGTGSTFVFGASSVQNEAWTSSFGQPISIIDNATPGQNEIHYAVPTGDGLLMGQSLLMLTGQPQDASNAAYSFLVGTTASGAGGFTIRDAKNRVNTTYYDPASGWHFLTPLLTNITGIVQCVEASAIGLLYGTGGRCGSGSGITNTAPANTFPLSDGTNLVTSPLSTDGSSIISTLPISVASDGVHAGALEAVGNTTRPTLSAHVFGIFGPNSASFTSYAWQPGVTPPSVGDTVIFEACVLGVCPFHYAAAGGVPAGSPGDLQMAGSGVFAASHLNDNGSVLVASEEVNATALSTGSGSTACGTAVGCAAFDGGSVAAAGASGAGSMRYDSITNTFKCTLDGGVEVDCNGAGAGTVTSSGSPVAGNVPVFTGATDIAPAAATDIANLFSGCSGTMYLGFDGFCHSSGSVTTALPANVLGDVYLSTGVAGTTTVDSTVFWHDVVAHTTHTQTLSLDGALGGQSAYAPGSGPSPIVAGAASISAPTSITKASITRLPATPAAGADVYTITDGLVSGLYTSGITATGSTGQTCSLATFNNSCSGSTATIALTGTDTIAGGTAIVVTASGTACASAPTSATASNGTASCSGTAVIGSAAVGTIRTPTTLAVTQTPVANGIPQLDSGGSIPTALIASSLGPVTAQFGAPSLNPLIDGSNFFIALAAQYTTAANTAGFILPRNCTLVRVQYILQLTTIDSAANNMTFHIATASTAGGAMTDLTDTVATQADNVHAASQVITTSDALTGGTFVALHLATQSTHTVSPVGAVGAHITCQ